MRFDPDESGLTHFKNRIRDIIAFEFYIQHLKNFCDWLIPVYSMRSIISDPMVRIFSLIAGYDLLYELFTLC